MPRRDHLVRRACIDIGSNTTRLLVADCDGNSLREVHQERVFTHLGSSRLPDGSVPEDKIHEVAAIVLRQHRAAEGKGAGQVRVVATAAIRAAPNRQLLARAIKAATGAHVEVLSDQEEARLAFVGVARTLGHRPDGQLGVVDVGGGSSELVVGNSPDDVTWWASFAVGSGDLAHRCLASDPPGEDELQDVRRRVAEVLDGVEVPRPVEAAAVGGSAASLAKLAGPLLDRSAFSRTIELLTSQPAPQIARRFGLDVQRVRLLPAGLLILQAAGERFGLPLQVGRGGVREGVLLECAGG